MPARKITRQDMSDAAEKYKNWGKWGPADEIGTLNYVTPEDIIASTKLVKKGKVISLALNFDHTGAVRGACIARVRRLYSTSLIQPRTRNARSKNHPPRHERRRREI